MGGAVDGVGSVGWVGVVVVDPGTVVVPATTPRSASASSNSCWSWSWARAVWRFVPHSW